MTTALHTPGPWASCPESAHRPEMVTHGNKVICSVWSGGSVSVISHEEWVANIRLITVAPKLLQALDALHQLVTLESALAFHPVNVNARLLIAEAGGAI